MSVLHAIALTSCLPERWLRSSSVLSERRIARLRERLSALQQRTDQPARRESYLFLLGIVQRQAEQQPELEPLLRSHELALQESRVFLQSCIQMASVSPNG